MLAVIDGRINIKLIIYELLEEIRIRIHDFIILQVVYNRFISIYQVHDVDFT